MINKVTIQLAYVVLHLLVVDVTDIKCPFNMTLFTLSDGSQDCEICRICPPGLIEVEPCGYRKDPVCICKDGFYRDALYNCWNCSSCPKGQYITIPCSWIEDVVCGNCTSCGERGEITPCRATSDTVCNDAGGEVLMIVVPVIFAIVILVVILVVICRRRGRCIYHSRASKPMPDDREIDKDEYQVPTSSTDGQALQSPRKEAIVTSPTSGSVKKRLKKSPRKMTQDPHAHPESMNLVGHRNNVEKFYNSVGIVVHEDRTITVFRVGPKHVMTAYSAVKDLLGSEKGYLEVTFGVCQTAEITYQIKYPSFFNMDIDVAVFNVFCISKTNSVLPEPVNLPEPVPLCILSDLPENPKLHFVSFENKTILHISHNEVLVKGGDSYTEAKQCIDSLQDTVEKSFLQTKENLRKKKKHILEKSINELNDGTVYVWSSSHNIRSQGTPGFATYDEGFGVVCLFTHAWPLRDELKELEDKSIQAMMPVGKEWYAGPSMAAVYKKIKEKDKVLAKQLFSTE